MAPSTQSIRKSPIVDTTTISTTPVEYGSGASTSVAASVSTPAWATSSPVGRCWNHDKGWSW